MWLEGLRKPAFLNNPALPSFPVFPVASPPLPGIGDKGREGEGSGEEVVGGERERYHEKAATAETTEGLRAMNGGGGGMTMGVMQPHPGSAPPTNSSASDMTRQQLQGRTRNSNTFDFL